jgi:hypothetical protein
MNCDIGVSIIHGTYTTVARSIVSFFPSYIVNFLLSSNFFFSYLLKVCLSHGN